MRHEYRAASSTGRAAIIRKLIRKGHKVFTYSMKPVMDARSKGGQLQLNASGLWVAEAPLFAR